MICAGLNEVFKLADGHLSVHVPHWKHNVALDPPLAANFSVNSDTTFFIDNTKNTSTPFIYKLDPATAPLPDCMFRVFKLLWTFIQ
jgi:hypothetical protein